jgi:hypothetical protein
MSGVMTGLGVQVRAGEGLDVGGAGLYVFDSSDAENDAWMGAVRSYLRVGYDCTAFAGSLISQGMCVGALILPFGPWTEENSAFAARLGTTVEGSELPLAEVLEAFPRQSRTGGNFTVSQGLVVCPFEDLELALQDDEALEVPVSGDLQVLIYSWDDDWVDGPIVIVTSDFLA